LVDATVSGSPGYAVGAGEAGVLFVTCGYEECTTRLLAGGELGPAQSFPTLGTAGHISLAHSDGAWLVALGYVAGGGRLVQLSAAAAELAETRHDIDIADAYNAPHVAPVADGFVVAWVPEDQVQLGRVDFDGELTLAPLWTNEMQRPKALHATGAALVLYAAQRDDCDGCGFVDRLQRVDATLAPVGEAAPLSGFGDIATTASGSPQFFAYDEVGHIAGARVELVTGGVSIGAAQPWSVASTEQTLPLGAAVRDGWLVAWHENPSSVDLHRQVRASFLSAQGAPQGAVFDVGAEGALLMDVACTRDGCVLALAEDPGFQTQALRGGFHRISHDSAVVEPLSGVWADNVKLAGSQHSTLTVTVTPGDTKLLFRIHDTDGGLIHEGFTTPLSSPSPLSRPLPLDVELDGESFVVAWYDAGRVYRLRVPVQGPIPSGPPQVLFVAQDVRRLDVAVQGTDWWAALQTSNGASWHANGRESALPGRGVSTLVGVGGVALAALGWSFDEGAALALAGPGEDSSEVVSFDDWRPHLSLPNQGQLLLSTTATDAALGAPVSRVVTRVVTIEGEAAGGAGGEGAGGEGAGGTPAADGAPMAGAGAVSEAGAFSEPSGGGNESASVRSPRHSQGCGCRAPAGRASSGAAWSLLLVAVLARGRRSRVRARS
jgi:hypothetical protein